MKILKISQRRSRKYDFDQPNNPYYKIIEKESPFKESDVITVYHGFRDADDAYITTLYGLSGKDKVGRAYSYESNNNPFGLFVTTNFNTAKEFASRGYIIEFDVQYRNLESPVWPSGSYTIQGESSQSWDWNNLDNQREEGRLKQREKALQNEFEAIRKSDRPELAESLMTPREYQALFVGHLPPNKISAVYTPILQEDGIPRVNDSWEKLSVQEFHDRFKERIQSIESGKTKLSDRNRNIKNRLFGPNENFNPQAIADKFFGSDFDQMIKQFKMFGKNQTKHIVENLLWPKQVPEMLQWVESLF